MYHTSLFLIFLITCKHVIIPLLKVAFFCNPHYMILPIRYVIFSTPFRIVAIFFQPREELCLKGHFTKGIVFAIFVVYLHENKSETIILTKTASFQY